MSDLDKTIATVIAHSERLRAAGVLKLSVDGVAFELAPYLAPADTSDSQLPEKPKRRGMIDDPALYGREDDAPVPGLRKDK